MPYLGTFLELNVPGMRKLGGVIVGNRPYLGTFLQLNVPGSWKELVVCRKDVLSGNISGAEVSRKKEACRSYRKK